MTIDPKMFEDLRFEVRDIRNILNKKDKPMASKLGSMMKKLLDADTQTLVKAGYINGDLELTEAGKTALWSIMFTSNKDALVAEAKEVLEAEKNK